MRPRNRILIVDDDHAFASAMRRAFEQDAQLSVTHVTDGRAARTVVFEHFWAGVILEPHVSGVSWFKMLSYLDGLEKTTPVLIVTAFDSGALRKAAIDRGYLWFPKPVDVARLKDVIANRAKPQSVAIQNQSAAPPNLARHEWELINEAILDNEGNLTRASRVLGIPRQTLYRKLRKHPPNR